MNRFAAALLILLCAGAGWAQELCPMQMDVPPMTLSDMYAKSEKIARAWQADAVPANISTTNNGPLDEQGKSEAWSLMFYSESADAKASFTAVRRASGLSTCTPTPPKACIIRS